MLKDEEDDACSIDVVASPVARRRLGGVAVVDVGGKHQKEALGGKHQKTSSKAFWASPNQDNLRKIPDKIGHSCWKIEKVTNITHNMNHGDDPKVQEQTFAIANKALERHRKDEAAKSRRK
ncbi:unnamed protein product, partial [Amoebophrya sp. A25]|eukprot:GSA25T00014931001.1